MSWQASNLHYIFMRCYCYIFQSERDRIVCVDGCTHTNLHTHPYTRDTHTHTYKNSLSLSRPDSCFLRSCEPKSVCGGRPACLQLCPLGPRELSDQSEPEQSEPEQSEPEQPSPGREREGGTTLHPYTTERETALLLSSSLWKMIQLIFLAWFRKY